MTCPAVTRTFAQQARAPEERIAAAAGVIRFGRTQRCNTGPGKAGANEPSGYPAAPSARRCTGERNAPVADEIVSVRCDIRLPLTFSLDDCDLIADHILREAGGTGVDA